MVPPGGRLVLLMVHSDSTPQAGSRYNLVSHRALFKLNVFKA